MRGTIVPLPAVLLSATVGDPRAVQRPDGKIVAVHYFTDARMGPGRHVAATIRGPRAR